MENSFIDYIKNFWKKYLNFKDKASSAEVFICVMVKVIMLILLLIMYGGLEEKLYSSSNYNRLNDLLIYIMLSYVFVSFIPMLSLIFRRTNDIGIKPIITILLIVISIFIPQLWIVILLALLFLKSELFGRKKEIINENNIQSSEEEKIKNTSVPFEYECVDFKKNSESIEKFKEIKGQIKKRASEIIEEYKEMTKKVCYDIETIEGEPGILDDKIGGNPYLPLGEEYPKNDYGTYLPLLVQINLKNMDIPGFPNTGILEFFMLQDEPDEMIVKYFEEGLGYQTVFPEIDPENSIAEKAYKIKVNKSIEYMPSFDVKFPENILKVINKLFNTNITQEDEIIDEIIEILNFNNIDRERIGFGGYRAYIDFGDEVKGFEDEECLFKLDSGMDGRFNIWDAGSISVLISRKKLEMKEFDEIETTFITG